MVYMNPYSAKELILVDASHLLYRSWNVFQRFSTKGGYNTGMQFGSLRVLESLKRRHPQASIVFVLDGSCSRRKEISPTYKLGRGTVDPDVYDPNSQGDVRAIVLSLGIPIAYREDLEADDIIANICNDDKFPAEEIFIYSGDNDFCQLVSPGLKRRVRVWKPGSGKKRPERIMDSADVYKEWGVEPRSLALYRSIEGDTSDKIQGLSRVPRETLRHAVAEKTTPTEFYSCGLAYFTPEWRQRLIEFRPQCELNFRLTKLPWELVTTPLVPGPREPVPVMLRQIFTRLEFNSYLKKFDELISLFSGGVSNEQQVSGQPV